MGENPMIDSVLVDSDLLIDLAHEDRVVEKYLHAIEKTFRLSISAITKIEILVGCRNRWRRKTLFIFSPGFQCLKFYPAFPKKRQNSFFNTISAITSWFLTHSLRQPPLKRKFL
jgi:hypothetical protein